MFSSSSDTLFSQKKTLVIDNGVASPAHNTSEETDLSSKNWNLDNGPVFEISLNKSDETKEAKKNTQSFSITDPSDLIIEQDEAAPRIAQAKVKLHIQKLSSTDQMSALLFELKNEKHFIRKNDAKFRIDLAKGLCKEVRNGGADAETRLNMLEAALHASILKESNTSKLKGIVKYGLSRAKIETPDSLRSESQLIILTDIRAIEKEIRFLPTLS